MLRKRIVLLAAVILVASTAIAADAEKFKVVVNAKNSMTTIETARLSKIFLKKVKSWPDGSEVVPVDLDPDSGVRERFSKYVHGRKVDAIKSYWQRQLFSGKAVPPVQFASEQDLLFFVSDIPGAVGYVSDSIPLIDGVKELDLGD